MGPLEVVSAWPDGRELVGDTTEPSISGNGRYVTYTSKNMKLVGLPRNGKEQVFRYDRKTKKTILLSVSPDGKVGEGDSNEAVMSPDGQTVVFTTKADNLLPGSPELDYGVVVLRDLRTGETTLISKRPDGTPARSARSGMLTDDASLVIFTAGEGDITGQRGPVIYDRAADTSTAVTAVAGGEEVELDDAWLSGDARWIAFDSDEPGIVPGDDNDRRDVFLMERATGAITLVSRSADGTVANDASWINDGRRGPFEGPKPMMSSDGSRIVFASSATDLAGAEDPDGIWVSERYALSVDTLTSELVTAMPDGSSSDDLSYAVSISADGRYAALQSQADLAGPSGNHWPKAFVRDLDRDLTRAASANQWADNIVIGGRRPHAVFATYKDLISEDTDDEWDIYHRRIW